MSDIYMNRVFRDTFKENFNPPTNNYVPVEYWQIGIKKQKKCQRGEDEGFFNEAEEQILKMFDDQRLTNTTTVDESGKVVT